MTIIIFAIIIRLRVAVHKIVTYPLFDTVIMVIIALRYIMPFYQRKNLLWRFFLNLFPEDSVLEQEQNYSYQEREKGGERVKIPKSFKILLVDFVCLWNTNCVYFFSNLIIQLIRPCCWRSGGGEKWEVLSPTLAIVIVSYSLSVTQSMSSKVSKLVLAYFD